MKAAEKKEQIKQEISQLFRAKRQMLNDMNLYSSKRYRFEQECIELENKKKKLEQEISLLENIKKLDL